MVTKRVDRRRARVTRQDASLERFSTLGNRSVPTSQSNRFILYRRWLPSSAEGSLGKITITRKRSVAIVETWTRRSNVARETVAITVKALVMTVILAIVGEISVTRGCSDLLGLNFELPQFSKYFGIFERRCTKLVGVETSALQSFGESVRNR